VISEFSRWAAPRKVRKGKLCKERKAGKCYCTKDHLIVHLGQFILNGQYVIDMDKRLPDARQSISLHAYYMPAPRHSLIHVTYRVPDLRHSMIHKAEAPPPPRQRFIHPAPCMPKVRAWIIHPAKEHKPAKSNILDTLPGYTLKYKQVFYSISFSIGAVPTDECRCLRF